VNGFMRGAAGMIGSLAVVGAAAGVTYGVASLVDDSYVEEDSALQETVPQAGATAAATASTYESNWIGGFLLTDNRDKLSVCVNAIGVTDKAGAEASAVANLAVALSELKKSPKWELAVQLSPLAANTQVVGGCPEGALSSVPTPGKFGEKVWNTPGRIVERASPHLVHVYVLPEEEILRIVGPSQNYHGAVEERLCYGDVCDVVTKALYYSPSDLSNAELVTREMGFALRLRSEP